MTVFWASIGLLLMLNILVAAHEAGHLITMKRAGVPVEVFSIGFGKRLVSRTWGGTRYQLALIPLGGYCRAEEGEGASMFGRVSYWQMTQIYLSGVAVNLVAAFLCFHTALWTGGRFTFWSAWPETFYLFGRITALVVVGLPSGLAATARLDGNEESFSGPIGIVDIGAQLMTTVPTVFLLAGILSFSLAIFNLLPLPILDGGQWVIGSAEFARGRVFSEKTRGILATVGLAVVLVVFVLTTANDVARLFT